MIVTDIETDGLLESVSKFHCAATYDYRSASYDRYRPGDFSAYIDTLEDEVARDGLIVFHNGYKYDVPVIEKLAKSLLNRDVNIPQRNVIDTLVISRLIYTNLKDTDAVLLRKGTLPGRRYGSHALEAWGYRLGVMKGEYKDDFKKAVEESGEGYIPGSEWLLFNEDMMEYNVQDVVVTKALLEKLLTDKHYFPKVDSVYEVSEDFWSGSVQALTVEHEIAWLLAKMERNGFPVDVEALENLSAELQTARSDILITLMNTFGSWYQPKGGKEAFRHPSTGQPLSVWKHGACKGKSIPRVIYPKQGGIFKKPKNKAQREGTSPCDLDTRLYVEGCPYTPVECVTFNPSSRAHIAKVLKDAGWIPTEFTPAGAPKLDDEVLEHVHVDDPHAQSCIELIQRYLMIQKRIGQVAEGDNAWLRLVGSDRRMHGSVNPMGTVTGRASHSYPNMGQVPANGKPYGETCRASFGAEHNITSGGLKDPWTHIGTDASGLELRCLGHYMAPFDGGRYANTVVNGDIHWQNVIAAGLYEDVPRDKHNEEHEAARNNGKTFIYGWLYGGGAAKLGSIVHGTAEDGKRLTKNFLEKTPGVAALRESIQMTLIKDSKWIGGEQKVTWKRRWLKGIDGRKIYIRSPHSALNALLQSAGAVICKQWLIETERLLQAANLKHGWSGDYCLMAWVHDEQQFAARTKEIAQFIAETAQEAMRIAGERFKFRCTLDTEAKIGRNWAECH